MSYEMKAQSSIEYFAIVGLGLLLASPFVLLVQQDVINLQTESEDARFTSSLDEMEETVEKVSAMGEPASDSFALIMPANIERTQLEDSYIIFTQNQSGQTTDYVRRLDVELGTVELPDERGRHKANAEAWENKVNITFEEDS